MDATLFLVLWLVSIIYFILFAMFVFHISIISFAMLSINAG